MASIIPRSWRNRAARLALTHASTLPAASASFLSTGAHDDGHVQDETCLISDRHKHRPWPSEDHAAFAFARLAAAGRTAIGPAEFVAALQRIQLDFGLGERELRRVFDSLDADGDGRLTLEEFKAGRGEHPLTQALVETLSGAGPASAAAAAFPAADFDASVSTADFYSAPVEAGFVGENKAVREALDAGYHGNYTAARQRFQDALIRSNVILDGAGSDRPWYVLTCGPMGAGKGWVLGWMSATGILELDRVSKIDPDAFKLRMPEWQVYQRSGRGAAAGTLTHAESAYVSQIAQHVALRNSMDVWVDGSLRNSAWYGEELARIRERHPHYRVAIVAVSASEDTIAGNIERRARETGRDVPEELRRATTAELIGGGVARLTPLVDLVASVRNHPPARTGESPAPTLQFVSLVDRSGNWDLVRELTARKR